MVMDAFQIPNDLLEQEMQRRTIKNALTSAIDGYVNNQSQAESPVQEAVANAPIIDKKQEILNKVRGGLADISAGYDDNARNKFDFSNLQADPTKSGWQRFGEALGTGQRLLSNPALQGLIAGAIYGKQRGSVGDGLKYGIDWAQNKANQNYYADAMGQPRRIIGGYSADDYKAQVDAKRKEFQNQIEQARYEVYAKNILDQIDWRDKNFNEKVREFALKYNLDERKLAQQIKYQSGMLSLGKERNAISKENNRIRNQRLADNDAVKLISTNIKNLNDLEKTQGYLSEDQANAREYYMQQLQDIAEADEWELME